ncbi:MAG: cytochrome c-type biogenesis protein [Candidatus Limnocylindria bacterium]
MKAMTVPLAAAALVALLAVGVFTALGPAGHVPATEQADALAAELRCPDCQGLSVADSPTASAVEIRRQIDELLAAGRSPDEVRRHFVDRYGEWILLAPTSPLAWWLPFAVVAASATLLVLWLGARRRGAAVRDAPVGPDDADGPDDGYRRRVRDEAEALDA